MTHRHVFALACQHMLVWWAHRRLVFYQLRSQDHVWKVESLRYSVCEERNNELTCVKVESLQGCLCFYSESSCVLIDLPSLQRLWACTVWESLFLLFSAPEAAAGWNIFLTSSPLLLLHSFCQNQQQRERGSSGRGELWRCRKRDQIPFGFIMRAESVRGRTWQAGISFVVSRWQREQLIEHLFDWETVSCQRACIQAWWLAVS